MENLKDQLIGGIVAQDYRTAAIFTKYNIDFCCNGNRSVETACIQQKADPEKVVSEIREVLTSPAQSDNISDSIKAWPLDLIVDYIEKKHHRYVTEQIPVLTANLDKLCRVHGDKHPELFEIKTLFGECADELTQHMKKEELILFPGIRKLVQTKQAGKKVLSLALAFGSVQNPINAMMHEHTTEGERFRKINELSDGYTPPADGCSTYKVTYALLREFEADLHLHIHLENNILFPYAIELESTCII